MGEEEWEAADPLDLFHKWLREAEASEPNDPNAAALATATGGGQPSVRIVLVKRADPRGFCFFTNAESQKGRQLAENPVAALCFHWKSLRRQVRVEGQVIELPGIEVDQYFHSRSRRSQLGTAVSRQSHPLISRKKLLAEVEKFEAEHPGQVPRPGHWRGYSVKPERMEFWTEGPDRLHDRILFTCGDGGWAKTRLYP